MIAALIAGARVHVEAQTRRALITQTWRLVRDVWPINERILVLRASLRELVAARMIKRDATEHAIDPHEFATGYVLLFLYRSRYAAKNVAIVTAPGDGARSRR